jgi:tetratricopeptide (TPR) repeat protein
MKSPRTTTRFTVVMLIAALAGSILTLGKVDRIRGKEATLEEILYVPSGKVVKRLSLGYSGLLADIYWTRAVQYYGNKLVHDEMHYDLLYPLLDITTDLDPHLLVAYQFGSVFLSQKPPVGAGQPEKAVALVEKGIRENPDYWRLYFTLGFIYYVDEKNYKAAEQAFLKGSEHPNALPWMKVMAAMMAQHAGEPAMAMEIWKRVYETTSDKTVRETAVQHIQAIQVDTAVPELERKIEAYRQTAGHLPSSWTDLIRARLLPGIPLDPTNTPYKLMPNGTVQVEDPDKLPFITAGVPPGWKPSHKPVPHNP